MISAIYFIESVAFPLLGVSAKKPWPINFYRKYEKLD